MFQDHLVIVFAVEHYNTLGLIRSLGEKGINPIYIAVKGKARVASTSKYISECHYVDSQREGYELLLEKYGREINKPFVLTIDDKTVSYMDDRFEELKDHFVFFNAGKAGRINEYMDKLNILEIARRHGLNTLRAYRCKNGEIPQEIRYPIITKAISPVIGGWKSDVHICNTPDELKSAYKEIQADTVLVQEYIEKKNEYCMEGVSVAHGKSVLISIASTYNYLLPNYYSPYMTVGNMNEHAIQEALHDVLAEIGFEGIFEIEFLIDQDGTLYFGEINFRNSTWSYASTVAGMNLPFLWVEGMVNGKLPEDARKEIDKPFNAMVEPIDYGKRVDTKKITIGEWLSDFKEAKCLYYYSKDDLMPFYEMVNNWGILK